MSLRGMSPALSCICLMMKLRYNVPRLKGHSHLCDRADLDTSFVSLKNVYLKPKSKVRVEYI